MASVLMLTQFYAHAVPTKKPKSHNHLIRLVLPFPNPQKTRKKQPQMLQLMPRMR